MSIPLILSPEASLTSRTKYSLIVKPEEPSTTIEEKVVPIAKLEFDWVSTRRSFKSLEYRVLFHK